MTVLLPRLDREQTEAQIEAVRTMRLAEVTARMPVREVVTTASVLGGLTIAELELAELRASVLGLATQHGYPTSTERLSVFDGRCARLLYEALSISPHEAAEEAVWSHLTVCWLLDVAMWRWGGIGDERRFRGDVNRNTFRRLWWRSEVFGSDFDLTQLGEDELVNIMERPTIAANRRLTRALANAFLERVRDGDESGRMTLMRDAGKRLVRLTPIVDFHALDDDELARIVRAILKAAAAGGSLAQPDLDGTVPKPVVSAGVEEIPSAVRFPVADERGPTARGVSDASELFEVVLGIARRTGRVTNAMVREVVDLDADDARRLLQDLVRQERLQRRGRAKGTYYVLGSDDPSTTTTPRPTAPPAPEPRGPAALRRYLRRGR